MMPDEQSEPSEWDYPKGTEYEYWKWLASVETDAARDYDKTVLTLATGTLALSITFAHEIAPTPVPGSTVALVAAWILLALSAMAVLAGLATTQYSFYVLREAVATRGLDEVRAAASRPGYRADRLTTVFNIGAGLMLAAGLIAFMIFAMMNLP
jgi:hypothetical protein